MHTWQSPIQMAKFSLHLRYKTGYFYYIPPLSFTFFLCFNRLVLLWLHQGYTDAIAVNSVMCEI